MEERGIHWDSNTEDIVCVCVCVCVRVCVCVCVFTIWYQGKHCVDFIKSSEMNSGLKLGTKTSDFINAKRWLGGYTHRTAAGKRTSSTKAHTHTHTHTHHTTHASTHPSNT